MKRGVLAWHWLPSMGRLRFDDKRKVIQGRTLVHKGEMVICKSGLHASVRALDALKYAPGGIVQRVECFDLGDSEEQTDKLVCRRRKMADATDTLREFARWCAMSVIDKWDAPPIVRQYLETGDESIRAAARNAARTAARDTARDAAWDAARGAAWAAARNAARAAQNEKLESMLMTLAPEGYREERNA